MREIVVAAPAFSLGWVMAKLFDPRRLKLGALVQPPYNPASQLPLLSELDTPGLVQVAAADLASLLSSVAPALSGTSGADVQATAQAASDNARTAGTAELSPGDLSALNAAVRRLHLDLLATLVVDDQKIAAYQLGLALSDTCWLPSADDKDATTFMVVFQRSQVAALKGWLAAAGSELPPGSAATIGHSLENWQDWIELNAARITAQWAAQSEPVARPVVEAVRIQAQAWHSVLVGDPQASGPSAMGAWVQAGSSAVRAARQLAASIVRRFWIPVTIAGVLVAGVIVLVLVDLRGAQQAWSGLATMVVTLAGGGAALRSAVNRVIGGVESEVWTAAQADARAWNVTWLPTLPQSPAQRRRVARSMDRLGIAMPKYRENLESFRAPASTATTRSGPVSSGPGTTTTASTAAGNPAAGDPGPVSSGPGTTPTASTAAADPAAADPAAGDSGPVSSGPGTTTTASTAAADPAAADPAAADPAAADPAAGDSGPRGSATASPADAIQQPADAPGIPPEDMQE